MRSLHSYEILSASGGQTQPGSDETYYYEFTTTYPSFSECLHMKYPTPYCQQLIDYHLSNVFLGGD